MSSRLDRAMAHYREHHQDPVNRATHLVGVPTIVYSLFVVLARCSLPVIGDGAVALVAAVLPVYLWLHPGVALAVAAWVVPLLQLARGLDPSLVWPHFLVAFVGGWFLQLFGHLIEGRRPALVDNLLQIFVAPVFITVEVLQVLGVMPAEAPEEVGGRI